MCFRKEYNATSRRKERDQNESKLEIENPREKGRRSMPFPDEMYDNLNLKKFMKI